MLNNFIEYINIVKLYYKENCNGGKSLFSFNCIKNHKKLLKSVSKYFTNPFCYSCYHAAHFNTIIVHTIWNCFILYPIRREIA